MTEIYLAKITCECPKCDKLFDIQRFVELFKPIKANDCRILCIDCKRSANIDNFAVHGSGYQVKVR